MVKVLIFALALQSANAMPTFREHLRNFCSRYLISEHPYQESFKKASNQEVIQEFRRLAALRYWQSLDAEQTDEYEMILSIMADRIVTSTGAQRELLEVAVRDYPGDGRLLWYLQE